MTFPANLNLEAAPYGPQPVLPVVGPQGGPYTVGGPQALTLLPSAARTATIASATQINNGYRGVSLSLVVTVNPGGAQTLLVELRAFDLVTGDDRVLLTVPASATPGGLWMLYPGLSGAAVEGVAITRNLALPPRWYVLVTHSGVGSWTYSLSAGVLP